MNYKSTIYASFDGMKLSGYLWEPATKPKAIINLVHGWGEHCGRFDKWAQLFAEKGFVVHAIDYRGHGKSDGRRGHIKRFDEYLEDVNVLVKESSKLHPELPQFIYGHSLGGNITTNYILKREHNFIGAVISSPWYKLSLDPSVFKLIVARIVRMIYPGFTRKAKLDINTLTHNEDVVKSYIDDPLVHGKISTRMFYEIYNAGRWVLENTDKIRLPILIQHGNEDKITSHEASKEFAENARNFDKDIIYKEWEGLYHELHNELEQETIFEYVYGWMLGEI